MTNIEKIRKEIERRKKVYLTKNGFPKGTIGAIKIETYEGLLAFIDSLPDEDENHGCGVEFPHFGANYPDAKCIDGYLWDMDSYEDGVYTIGGDDPCPICNTEKWMKDVLDDEIFKTRDEALEYVKMLKSKYKHKDSLPEEKPSEDLEGKQMIKELKERIVGLDNNGNPIAAAPPDIPMIVEKVNEIIRCLNATQRE